METTTTKFQAASPMPSPTTSPLSVPVSMMRPKAPRRSFAWLSWHVVALPFVGAYHFLAHFLRGPAFPHWKPSESTMIGIMRYLMSTDRVLEYLDDIWESIDVTDPGLKESEGDAVVEEAQKSAAHSPGSTAYGFLLLRRLLRRRTRINILATKSDRELESMARKPLTHPSDPFHDLIAYHSETAKGAPIPWTWHVPVDRLQYKRWAVKEIQRLDTQLRTVYEYQRPEFFPKRNPAYAAFMGASHRHPETEIGQTPSDGLTILEKDWPGYSLDERDIHSPFSRDVSETMYAEWSVFEPVASQEYQAPRKEDEKVILYFHGGAMLFLSPATHREICMNVAKYSGAKVFAIDYRLAPEHIYPDAIYDAVSAYVHLLRKEKYRPDQIFFMGDSAGGNLVFAAGLFLVDHRERLCEVLGMSKEELGLPAGLIGNAPWVDLSCSLISHQLNEHKDYLPNTGNSHLSGTPLPNSGFPYWGGVEAIVDGWPALRPHSLKPWHQRIWGRVSVRAKETQERLLKAYERMMAKRVQYEQAIASERYLSPALAREAFAHPDCPPMLIHVGSAEMILSDSLAIYANSIPDLSKEKPFWKTVVESFTHSLVDKTFIGSFLPRSYRTGKPGKNEKTLPIVTDVTNELASTLTSHVPLSRGKACIQVFSGRVHVFQLIPSAAARWSFIQFARWIVDPKRGQTDGGIYLQDI